MRVRKMRKKSKIERPNYMHKIGGDHIVRFYFDEKSNHPFMAISKNKNYVSGHQMTSHPELTSKGEVKKSYQKFHSNPNQSKKKKKSYYRKQIRRMIGLERMTQKRGWSISKRDLKILKNVDKKVIKNVRHAKN